MDYVIEDRTRAAWPGRLPYRDAATRPGRGYQSREQAEARLGRVVEHYNATRGCAPGDLRIVERARCSVCLRPGATLSGNAYGCPVHGIRRMI